MDAFHITCIINCKLDAFIDVNSFLRLINTPNSLLLLILSHNMHPFIHIYIILLCIISSFFNSQATDTKPQTQSSLVLGLSHVRSLYTPSMTLLNSTKYDFLDIVEPVTAYTDGYLLSLNLGTPPQVFQVYLDTGSDLTWVPCGTSSYQCMECGDQHSSSKPTPMFLPSQSSSNTWDLCGSRFCVDVHSSDNRFDPCAAVGCAIPAFTSGLCPRPCPPFSYTYGGGALVLGSLARDSVTLHGSIHGIDPLSPVEFPGFSFGCVGSSIREPIGIAGFGKGTLSLPSQLGFLGKGFSHCFLGFRFARNPNFTSPLVMGDLALSSATDDGGFIFTPMLKSVTYPNFYYIGLEGVSFGADGGSASTMAAAPPSLSGVDSQGNGGVLVDTGTTYTHLPDPFYASLLASLAAVVPYGRSRDMEARTGFDLCFRVPCTRAPCAAEDDELPPISLHLAGGGRLTLPKLSSYYPVTAVRDSVVVKCLLFQRMDDDGGDAGGGGASGPGAVLGSFQMQNVEVVYDLVAGRVGFLPRDCAVRA